MTKHQDIDWVGAWFPYLRKNGEFTDVYFGKKDHSTGEISHHFLPHGDYDGIGGIAYLLRSEGYSYSTLPEVTVHKRPSFWRWLLGIFIYLLDSGVRKTRWKKRNYELQGEKLTPFVHTFDVNETKTILKLSKELNVTVNTFLLYTLNKTIDKLLLEENSSNWWLLPVNMRGTAHKPRDTSNHASYTTAKIVPNMTLESLHQQIKNTMNKCYHHGAWWGVNLGRYIGPKGMDRVLLKYYKAQHSWVGTLSNLGVWNNSEDISNVSWSCCPPVTKGHPIASGVLTYNGRLAISMLVHPILGEHKQLAPEIMQHWVEEIDLFMKETQK